MLNIYLYKNKIKHMNKKYKNNPFNKKRNPFKKKIKGFNLDDILDKKMEYPREIEDYVKRHIQERINNNRNNKLDQLGILALNYDNNRK